MGLKMFCSIFEDTKLLSQLVLDCTTNLLLEYLVMPDLDSAYIQSIMRKLSFALHLQQCTFFKSASLEKFILLAQILIVQHKNNTKLCSVYSWSY